MAFTDFTRKGHKTIGDRIAAELEALGDQLGVKFNVGGGQIGVTDLTIKVVATTNDPQLAIEQAKRDLGMYGGRFDLEANDHGAEFTSQRDKYTLTGVHSNRPKYPIIGKCMRTGKAFKFTTSVVAEIIKGRASRPLPKIAPSTQTDDRYADSATF